MNKTGSTHLTLENRQTILRMIEDGFKLWEIANAVKKDPRAVSREVRNRRELTQRPKHFVERNEIYEAPCKRCSRFPFVCDGCKTKRSCMYLMRFYYHPERADAHYRRTLRDARIGLNLTEEEFLKLDKTLYHGVSKGQSLYHVFVNNDDLPVSLRTAYRYVELNLLSTKNIDLRRKVRLRRRRTEKKPRVIVDIRSRINRLYTDYIRYLVKNPGIPVTQMDLVESPKGIPHALLTLHLTSIRFMLAFPVPDKTTTSVTKVFQKLQTLLTPEEYTKLFHITLTDRGSEFSAPEAIEVHQKTGEVLAKVFYCDPQASNQKPQIEENHALLRYIIPKGTNLSFLDQPKTNLMLSHLNSFSRDVIGTSPIELFKIYYGEELLNKLKIRAVHPDSVYLKPDLFPQ